MPYVGRFLLLELIFSVLHDGSLHLCFVPAVWLLRDSSVTKTSRGCATSDSMRFRDFLQQPGHDRETLEDADWRIRSGETVR